MSRLNFVCRHAFYHVLVSEPFSRAPLCWGQLGVSGFYLYELGLPAAEHAVARGLEVVPYPGRAHVVPTIPILLAYHALGSLALGCIPLDIAPSAPASVVSHGSVYAHAA